MSATSRKARWARACCAGLLGVALAGACMAADVPSSPRRRGNYFTEKVPGTNDYAITDKPIIIATQAQLARQRAISAMQILNRSSDLESLKQVFDLVYDSYILLRTATHGIDQAMFRTKYPNPVLNWRKEHIMEIRMHLNTCMRQIENEQKWQDGQWIGLFTEHLEEALRLFEALLPRML